MLSPRKAALISLCLLAACGEPSRPSSEPSPRPSAGSEMEPADDSRWRSMIGLPPDALPPPSPGGADYAAERSAIANLHLKRFAGPTARDMASVNEWAKTVFVAWVQERGAATSHVARPLLGSSDGVGVALGAYAYDDLAAQFLSAPVPAEMEADDDLRQLYRSSLEITAGPWIHQAVDGYRECIQRTSQAGAALSLWTRFCAARVDAWAPIAERVPRVREQKEPVAQALAEPLPALRWPAVCDAKLGRDRADTPEPPSEPLHIAMLSAEPGPLRTEDVERLLVRSGEWVHERTKISVIDRSIVRDAEQRARRGELREGLVCAAPVELERILEATYPNLAFGYVGATCHGPFPRECKLAIAFRRSRAGLRLNAPPDLPRDTDAVRLASRGLEVADWLAAVTRLQFKKEELPGDILGVWSPPPTSRAFKWFAMAHGAWRDPNEPDQRLAPLAEPMAACDLEPPVDPLINFTLDVALDGRVSVVHGLDDPSEGHLCARRVLTSLAFSAGEGPRRITVQGKPAPRGPFRSDAFRIVKVGGNGAGPAVQSTLEAWPLVAAIEQCKQGHQPADAAAWDVTLALTAEGRVARASVKHLAGPASAAVTDCVREALTRLKLPCPAHADAKVTARICAAAAAASP